MEPTEEVKRKIIEQEMTMWANTMYQAQVRKRAAEIAGLEPDEIEAYKKQVDRCARMIAAHEEQLAELEG